MGDPSNIFCGIETSPGLSPGNYIQGMGKTYIGDYTQIAPNVGIISANHELEDNRKHIIEDVYIGKYCWIGMGAQYTARHSFRGLYNCCGWFNSNQII